MSCQSDKITQMAARFLQKAHGRLPYIVLIKLMYYADKEMLLQYGRPITFDRWVSMKNGPVLSDTLNLIRMPDEVAPKYWSSSIKTDGYDVLLVAPAERDRLSELEEAILEKTYA